MNIRLANSKTDYIRNLINGRYFLARCNMIAEQIVKEDIKEKIDGCTKSLEFMRAEYAHQKMQAIVSLRGSVFGKEDLKNNFNLTDKDIIELEKDYYDGKIIREAKDYDEIYNKTIGKAEFVKE